jgi:exopolysaccharide production protein ExoZ
LPPARPTLAEYAPVRPGSLIDVKSNPFLQNVQCLRAVAAYMVVLYHARLLTPIGSMVSFDFGNAGVDVFFFISGFIINHVGARDDVGAPLRFLVKRAIRIVPLYWVLTLAIGIVGQAMPSLAGAGGRPDIGRILMSLFFIPYYDNTGEMHPVLFMGWTLNYEIFFYLLFAAALLIRTEMRRLLAVSGVLLALVVTGWITHPTGAAATTYTSPLLLEFAVGMWMNRVYRALPERSWSALPRLALIVAMLGAFAVLAAGDYAWPDIAREIKWGIPAFVIVATALLLEHGGATIGWRWLLLLGEASFAIYLVHPFAIKAVSLIYARLGVTALPVHAVALLTLYVIVAAVGLAFHLLVEKPTIRALRHRIVPRDPPSVAAP